jgi:TonB-linked SusC/RagA family outer membrane protein
MRKKIKGAFSLTVFLFLSLYLAAQPKKITGVVSSQEDGSILANANVKVKDGTQATMTDASGVFTLDVSKGDVLLVSFSGYEPQEITITDQEQLRISLRLSSSKLEEVVVIGYGKQSRRNLAGAVSSVNSKAFESGAITNVGTALQGSVTGLRIQQTTGMPGSTPRIVFRGGSEFNGSGSPLVVLDGQVVPSLYGINSADIESIDVLKDAASTAIYGAQAANGVILVTTKKGKPGRVQVTYSGKLAQNYVRRNPVEYLSAADYISWNRRGLANKYEAAFMDNNTAEMNATRNDLVATNGWNLNSAFEASNGKYTTQLVGTDNRHLLNDPRWQLLVDRNPFDPDQMDSILFTSISQRELEDMILQKNMYKDHYVNVSGANEMGNFSLGLGTLEDVGMVLGSSLKRQSLNFNGGLKLSKDFTVSLNLSGWNSKTNPPYRTADNGTNIVGGLLQRFAGIAPTIRFNDDVTGEMLPGGDGGTMGNPAYLKDKFFDETKERRIMGNLNLEYALSPVLKLTGGASGYFRFWEDQSFAKAFQNGTGGSMNTTRSASFAIQSGGRYSYNGFLQYHNRFNQHDINAMAGGEFFEFRQYEYSASARGAVTDLIPYLSASTQAVGVPRSSFASWNKMASAIGRINYSYASKYLLNVNLRYDGTSKLADNRYGIFPGISAGWNLHYENFFEESVFSKYISTFKPRISWGQNGNLGPVSDFATYAVYDGNGIYNGVSGFAPNRLTNTALKWEKVSALNIGVDIGLAKDRISIIADYFIKDVYDKISTLSTPAWIGYEAFVTNLGQLRNKGIELEIKANIIKPGNDQGLTWDLAANLSYVKNFAVKLPDNGLENNRQSTFQVADPNTGKVIQVGGLQEGIRIGLDEIWAPVYDGIYRTQEEINKDANIYNTYLPFNNKDLKLLGDVKWRDVDRNDTIDFKDKVYVGRTTPTLQGGFSSFLSFRNFSLYSRFDYSLGFVILNQMWMRGMTQVQGSQNGPVDVKNTWTYDNPDAPLPRYYRNNYGRNYFLEATSNAAANYWQKGDYLALREVTLSYNLPNKLIDGALDGRIKSARFYCSGNDLVYFTQYNGTFPEEGGNDAGRFPLPRRVTFGVNVTF